MSRRRVAYPYCPTLRRATRRVTSRAPAGSPRAVRLDVATGVKTPRAWRCATPRGPGKALRRPAAVAAPAGRHPRKSPTVPCLPPNNTERKGPPWIWVCPGARPTARPPAPRRPPAPSDYRPCSRGAVPFSADIPDTESHTTRSEGVTWSHTPTPLTAGRQVPHRCCAPAVMGQWCRSVLRPRRQRRRRVNRCGAGRFERAALPGVPSARSTGLQRNSNVVR